MMLFLYLKTKKILFLIIPIIIVSVNQIEFAGTIENVNGFVMYKTNSGLYAKNLWAWLDINGDSVKECYRFDEDGHIAVNYIGNDGRRTNDKGQLIENGFVIKKLASGKVVKGEGVPYVNVKVSTGSIINNTGSRVMDNLPFEVARRNGNTILTTRLKEEVVIPIDKNVSTGSNVIYANGASGAISTINSSGTIVSNNSIVAGKDITRYITAKKNAKNDEETEKYIEYLPHYTLMGNEHEILINLLNDNRDIWETHLPLTEFFKSKYKNNKINSDSSIVRFSWSQLQDDSIIYEYRELKDNEFAVFGYDSYNNIYALIYQLDIKNYDINDIKLIDKLLIKDNNGKYNDEAKLKINEKNYMGIFEAIIFPKFYYDKIKKEYNEIPTTSRYNVALTQMFLDKYGYERDIIVNETGVPMSSYELKNGNFEKRFFECVCHYKAKKIGVKYVIEFVLSSEGELDSVTIIKD